MSTSTALKYWRYISLSFLALVMLGLAACGGGSDSGSSSSVATPSVFYVVSNTNDSGAGSLRDAITAVNSASTSQYSGITFSVGGTITLLSDLPAITKKVLIDGGTAPGYVAGKTTTAPLVAVNFNNVASGFTFNSGSAGSGIYALSIIGSNSNGITLNAGNIVLLRNYIGLNLSGAAAGNAKDGIYISASSTNNVIGTNPNSISGLYSNVISSNTQNGIQIYGSAGNKIQANAIGTNPAGTARIANGFNGIYVTYYAVDNTIGGTAYVNSATGQTNNPTGNKGTVPIVSIAPPLGNLISGNSRNGVLIDGGSELTVLSGNFIGTNNVGTAAVSNTLDGVLIRNANNNQLIGCTFEDNPFIYYNVLSGNGGNGLHIADSNAILVQANFFGAGANNASMVPNGGHGILVDGSSAGVQVGGVIPLGNVSAGNTLDGIKVSGTASGFTTFNTFGGLYAFQGAAPNGGNGITIDSTGGNNLVRTNVFSGNMHHGIEISGNASGVTVDPNVVGLNTEGTGTLANGPGTNGAGNGGSGVYIAGTAHGNFIGGYNNSVIPQNTFSGNARYGIEIVGTANNNTVFNSVIGLGTTQVSAFGNGLGGIYIGGGSNNNSVIAYTPSSSYTAMSSVISGNTGDGVLIADTAFNNTVQGNYFGYGKLSIVGNLVAGLFPNTLLPIHVTSSNSGNVITPNNP